MTRCLIHFSNSGNKQKDIDLVHSSIYYRLIMTCPGILFHPRICAQCDNVGWISQDRICPECYSESIPEYLPEPRSSDEDRFWRNEPGRGVF